MKKTNLLLAAAIVSQGICPIVGASAEEALLYATMDVYNDAGRYVTGIGGLEEIKGTINIDGSRDKNADVYVAVYGNGSKLVKLEKQSIEKAPAEVDFNISGLPAEENQSVKAFVWDGTTPVANAVDVWSVHSDGYYNYFGSNTGIFGTSSDNVTTEWQVADEQNGAYSNLSSGISTGGWGESRANKWIKFVVTSNGTKYESEPRQIHYNWRTARKDKVDFSDAPVTAPDENVFTVDGMDFILLDITEASTGRFMAVSKNSVGGKINIAGNNYKSMAQYLNSDEFKALLPTGILENYDNSNRLAWLTQANNFWDGNENLYDGGLGIGLLDINEVIEYKDKIGLSNDGKRWYTRSLYNSSANGSARHIISASGNASGEYKNAADTYVRPLVYLNQNFFLNTKIDLSKAGANVKQALFKTYTKAEMLAAGYSEEELGVYFDNNGVLENVRIDGTVAVNETVSAEFDMFDFTAPDEEVLMALSYKWVAADSADGNYSNIINANEKSLKLTADLDGKYIKAIVYLPNGRAYETAPIFAQILDSEFAGTIENPEIRGIFEAGNVLDFGYASTDVTNADIISYSWMQSTAADGEYTLVGEDASCVTADTDKTTYYKLSVMLKSGKEYETAPVEVGGRNVKQYKNYKLKSTTEETGAEFKFSVGGQDFILLDTINTSDKARFMVLADKTYGKINKQRINELFEEINKDAFKAKLPADIIKSAATDVWYSGSLNAWGDYKEGIRAGIGLLSIEEIEKYADRISLAATTLSDNALSSWLTRTNAVSSGNGNNLYGIYSSTLEAKEIYNPNGEIRPLVYLNKDFFTDTVIDLSKAGAEVIKTINSQYSYDELLNAGYDTEVLDLYCAETGTIENVAITGTPSYDAPLGISYDFSGISEAEAAISFSWQISDTQDSNFVHVKGGNARNFQPTMETIGKYLRAVVYLPNGEAVYSEPMLIEMSGDFNGTISSCGIKGILSAGNVLYFDYVSDDVTDEDIVAYQWSVSTAADGTYENAGKEASVVTQDVTTKRYYKAAVTLKNGVEYSTEPVEVAPRIANEKKNYTLAADVLDFTDGEYIFTVEGQDFILLDTIETSDTARYMVLAENTYGKYALDATTLNSAEFLNKLPNAITSHIADKVWYHGSKNAWGDYKTGALTGVYVPSVEELEKYKNIIGVAAINLTDRDSVENPIPVKWILRNNAANAADGGYLYGIDGNAMSVLNNCKGNGYEIRPMFYLDKDFFKTEADNIEFMGIKVEEMIKNS